MFGGIFVLWRELRKRTQIGSKVLVLAPFLTGLLCGVPFLGAASLMPGSTWIAKHPEDPWWVDFLCFLLALLLPVISAEIHFAAQRAWSAFRARGANTTG